MWLSLLWQNKRIAGEIIGLVLAVVLIWWFGFHNPQKIKELEADKAELVRQLEAGKQAATLLDDIQKGRVKNLEKVQAQISTIHSSSIPRRTVLIRDGGLLPAVFPSGTAR